MPIKIKKYLIYGCLSLALWQPSHALILYDGLNSKNLSAPDSDREAIFNSVASVCNATGGDRQGSAVRIRGKYLLTANHVSLSTHVTFDGTTYWARDTSFTPITFDDVDLKLFKLLKDPGTESIELHTTAAGDDVSSSSFFGRPPFNSVDVIGTLVGWGKGTAENGSGFVDGEDQTWTWSNTYSKRWGTNRIDSSSTRNSSETYAYSYTQLSIDLDTDAGSDEAALAIYDSGSGIFVENDGIWRLAGIATLVTTSGSSTFSSSTSAKDSNYFLRISTYASDIEAMIPDATILSGWKVDHSLYDTDADNTADTDGDGIGQLLEFALGGDPNVNDISILPTHALVEDSGSTYLELTVTRPTDLQGITYTPVTTTDLTNWPNDSTGIVDATPTSTDNGDGTETLTYRRSQAVSNAEQAFIRIEVSEN